MRHSLTQLLAASGGSSPSGAAWPLTGAGQTPRGRDGGGEGDPSAGRPKQQQQEKEAAEGPPEVWEQEDWFPGLELGDLLEAARPEWDAELSGCLCGEAGRGRGGRRSGGAGSRLKAAAAARLNRLKKKQYVLGLESRLQGLAAENRQLRDRNRGLSRRLRELERESGYLRAVLANQSALGQLLSRLAGTRAGGLRLGTSLFRDGRLQQQQQQQQQPLRAGGDSGDHDYALPNARPPGSEQPPGAEPEEEEWAAPGGICLHVERDQFLF
ncbi:CREB/ATF bZIP transcription factor isoform X2 [Coturnix japonica]|uniref:CREB/ATF bZIP transcription factor isoform X2 n=1 Tax=Coturnix japonica TaxID=93934 RepID=UPI00077805E0|nr:CREB/ATF bZIP transcription factor isoform X2 [Coturnix japonica]